MPWPTRTPDKRIAAFWSWWAGARDRLRTALDAGQAEPELSALGRRIRALDARLDWEIGGGASARYCLVLRPHRDARLRLITLAWAAAAPRSDGYWEYAPSRPPLQDLGTVPIADREIDLADLRFEPTWDEDREIANLAAWPSGLPSADPDVAYNLAAVTLNRLLGDDAVQRWLGSLRVDPDASGGLSPAELMAWLRHRMDGATGERWVTVRRQDQSGRAVALRYNAALKRIDHPGAGDGLRVTLHRKIEPVDRAEDPATTVAVRALAEVLGPETIRASEISEAGRLTVEFLTPDGRRAERVARAWADANRAYWPDVARRPMPNWTSFGVDDEDLHAAPAWTDAWTFKTARSSNALDLRARWVRRHPWRLLAGPLGLGITSLVLAAMVPAWTYAASVLFIGAAGLAGLGISVWLLADDYLALRANPALGCLYLVVHGYKGLFVLVFALFALFVFVFSIAAR